MSKFEKGHEKKGGRKKGTPNRTTTEIREFLTKVYDDNQQKYLQSDIDSMKPFQRQTILNQIGNKVLPNLTKNDDTTTLQGGIDVIISYGKVPEPDDEDDIEYNKNDDDEY